MPVSYRRQKAQIAGDPFKIPFVGPFLESVNPKFENYHRKWLSGALSCVSVFHKFVVIAADREMARKVLNSPAYVKPCLVDVARKILRPENWVFLDGKAHVEYRKGLNTLFTRSAMQRYLPGQQDVYNEYFAQLVRESRLSPGKPQPIVYRLRELMCAVSCRTFVGHYLSHDAVRQIALDFYDVTAALQLVNFPFILPFTKPWYGKRAADRILDAFSTCAAKSKVRMQSRREPPNCILDRWVAGMIDSDRHRAGQLPADHDVPTPLLRMFSDHEISMTLLTFLFASQDATSSACSWLLQTMADRPDVLERVREEGARLHPDSSREVTFEELESMVSLLPLSAQTINACVVRTPLTLQTFTRACVKESLRYRPPVIMIPYLARKAFPIPEHNYTVPANTMIVPSFWLALHDPTAYPNPDLYDPDRWLDPNGPAEQHTRNWLVFGTGPHYCLGQNYAVFNLCLLLHKAAMELDLTHEVTPLSEKMEVFATIFPQDGLRLGMEWREGRGKAA